MAYSDRQSRAITQIAYMELEDRYSDYCRTNGVDRAPLSEILSKKEYNKLKKIGVTDSELESWSISGVHNENSDNGFYACIIETGTGEAAVGFRGSEEMGKLDNVINDWVGADLGLVNSTCTNQQKEVDNFLRKYKDKLNSYDNLSMIGHSLGGNLAEYSTIVSEKYGLDDNIKQCVSMDGPGFSEEFIRKYRDEIKKMSEKMYHPRWSFVGTMLNDLPGVEYQYVEVSNEANAIDDKDYNDATRHDTKYLVYNGDDFVSSEQDRLSEITSVISEGVDHLPTPIGNALITLVGGVWIGITWAKGEIFNGNGITSTGWGIIAAVVSSIAIFGLETVITTVFSVVIAVVAVLLVAIVTELIYDLVLQVVDVICETVEKVYAWSKEKLNEIKSIALDLIESVKEWFKSRINTLSNIVSIPQQIKLDTIKLTTYASRLSKVNGRINTLDGRLDNLYWQVGLQGLWNLLQADLLTGYSWRLNRCASYLNTTATSFEKVEVKLAK